MFMKSIDLVIYRAAMATQEEREVTKFRHKETFINSFLFKLSVQDVHGLFH